jgi:hypothetical protein
MPCSSSNGSPDPAQSQDGLVATSHRYSRAGRGTRRFSTQSVYRHAKADSHSRPLVEGLTQTGGRSPVRRPDEVWHRRQADKEITSARRFSVNRAQAHHPTPHHLASTDVTQRSPDISCPDRQGSDRRLPAALHQQAQSTTSATKYALAGRADLRDGQLRELLRFDRMGRRMASLPRCRTGG